MLERERRLSSGCWSVDDPDPKLTDSASSSAIQALGCLYSKGGANR